MKFVKNLCYLKSFQSLVKQKILNVEIVQKRKSTVKLTNSTPPSHLRSMLKPIIILSVIPALIFYYCLQMMSFEISAAATLFLTILIAKMMWKRKIFQNAWHSAELHSLTHDELKEYVKTTYTPSKLKIQYYKVKSWNSLSDEAQYQLLHEFQIIFTDHSTTREKIINFLKKFNKANYNKGLDTYRKYMNQASASANQKSHKSKYKINYSNAFQTEKPINFNLFSKRKSSSFSSSSKTQNPRRKLRSSSSSSLFTSKPLTFKRKSLKKKMSMNDW